MIYFIIITRYYSVSYARTDECEEKKEKAPIYIRDVRENRETIEDRAFSRERKTSSIMWTRAHAHARAYTHTHTHIRREDHDEWYLFSLPSLLYSRRSFFLRGQTRFLQYPPRAAASLFASSRRCSHPKSSSVDPGCPRKILSFSDLASPPVIKYSACRVIERVSTTPIN